MKAEDIAAVIERDLLSDNLSQRPPSPHAGPVATRSSLAHTAGSMQTSVQSVAKTIMTMAIRPTNSNNSAKAI